MAPKTPYIKDLRRIYGGARELGISDEDLHMLLRDLTGKESFKKTNKAERWKMIQDLQSKGAYRYKGRAGEGTRAPRKGTDIISAEQQKKIEEMWDRLVELGIGNAVRQQWRAAFCHRIIGKPWPQKVWEGQKLIEALKKRIQQEEKRV